MERDFWLERWDTNQLGWHRSDTNPQLARHWPQLGIPAGAAVFVPLCGKSLDMRYLESAGHPVVGAELSETAVHAYFDEAGEEPVRAELPGLTRYAGPRTTLYCGDLFDLGPSEVPTTVQAVYDRGSLVALPPAVRERYVDHLLRIVLPGTHMLIIALEYDQERIDGPPHSVTEEEIRSRYGTRCQVTLLERTPTSDLPKPFLDAGILSAQETVYSIIKDR